MKIRILGSAAGGGVPQWNCRCANCEAARIGPLHVGKPEPDAPARVPGPPLAGASGSGCRNGAPHVRPRTQSSVAVSADDRTWYLLNVSPDIRQQILAFPPLGPPEEKERGQGIAGCVLTDAEFDHTAGLLFLREGGPLAIYSTSLVRSWLNRYFPIEPLLAHFANPAWIDLPLQKPVMLTGGLLIRAFEIGRHVPRFVAEEATGAAGSVIGLLITDPRTDGRLLYAPCVGTLSEPLTSLAKKADAILIDGTFWSDNEPLRFGQRTALQMGHIPVSGQQGSLSWLAELSIRHRVYIHVNNTNPMLNEQSTEYRTVNDCGVRVGVDGDMFAL